MKIVNDSRQPSKNVFEHEYHNFVGAAYQTQDTNKKSKPSSGYIRSTKRDSNSVSATGRIGITSGANMFNTQSAVDSYKIDSKK